jgi:hypothetical protein
MDGGVCAGGYVRLIVRVGMQGRLRSALVLIAANGYVQVLFVVIFLHNKMTKIMRVNESFL